MQLSKTIDQKIYSEEEKITKISEHFSEILRIMGLNLNDDSLKETPQRVAKMYINELFSGLNPENFPKITYFAHPGQSLNTEGKVCKQSITISNIAVHSICEHHLIPFIGTAYIKYVPNQKILGLSKINRIVNYFSRRPQLQERLTKQIAECLQMVLETDDISVTIKAKHYCVIMRGVEDLNSETITECHMGKFIPQ